MMRIGKHGHTVLELKSPFNISCRAVVEARGNFVAAGKSAGNECRRWHGTNRQCKLGDKGETNFCSSTTCSLCSIVKSSYDINFFGKKTGWGRYLVYIINGLMTMFEFNYAA